MLRRTLPLLLVCAASLPLGQARGAGLARLEFRIAAEPGVATRIAAFVSQKQDCTEGTVAAVRVVAVPDHGDLEVKRTKALFADAPCPEVEATATEVLYRSKPDYNGSDTLTIEVRSGSGRVHTHLYEIKVEPPDSRESERVRPTSAGGQTLRT